MMIRCLFQTSLLLIAAAIAFAQPCKTVVGYYPGWQWYDRAQLVRPSTIDYSQYTIINYAFFQPNADGSITGLDAWADENLLLGQKNWSTEPPSYYPNTSLVDLAHNNGVLVLISVGGWTLSHNFPSIAADPLKRETFAQSCVQLVEQYNLDGIDIDWEYPGYAIHNGTPADEANYVLLLLEVRNALDELETTTSENYLLTAALPAGVEHMENIAWQQMEPLLDYMNIMSYDFNGTWNTECNHNAPLYLPEVSAPLFSCNDAICLLMNYYNVPSEKIVMGIPFYGRSMKTNGTPALFAPILNGAADITTYWQDEGSPLYYNILLQSSLFTEHWDNTAHVPYLTGNGTLNTFVSYDNETSVSEKGAYIVEQNLAGAIIWEITGDYIETFPGSGVVASTPLATVLNEALCSVSCPADLNDDGVINISDLLVFMSSFGGTASCGVTEMNGDGAVNTTDLLLFMSAFGELCE